MQKKFLCFVGVWLDLVNQAELITDHLHPAPCSVEWGCVCLGLHHGVTTSTHCHQMSLELETGGFVLSFKTRSICLKGHHVCIFSKSQQFLILPGVWYCMLNQALGIPLRDWSIKHKHGLEKRQITLCQLIKLSLTGTPPAAWINNLCGVFTDGRLQVASHAACSLFLYGCMEKFACSVNWLNSQFCSIMPGQPSVDWFMGRCLHRWQIMII